MNINLPPRDYEALSAYLDGEISSRDKARLEGRLQADAGLRQELNEMRKTRILLRSQPRLRAPRNFTLTPQMAGMRAASSARMGAYPVLRLASVLAAVFFVLVLVGDLVGSSMQPSLVAMSETGQMPNAFPAMGLGGGGGGSGGDAIPPVAMAPMEAQDTGEAALQPEATFQAAPEQGALKKAPEEAPQPELPAAETGLMQAQPAVREAEPVDAVDADAALEAPVSELADHEQPGQESPVEPVQRAWPILRVLQVILAMIAIAAGAAALVMRRLGRIS